MTAETIDEAIELAAACLPEGWVIHLHTEAGAAWVGLEKVDYELRFEPGFTDASLAEQICELVELAKERSQSSAP